MNPVARLAWLRFLLHIPGRCQGPHRRQRSLPKSQPCCTRECVSPVRRSSLSPYVFLLVKQLLLKRRKDTMWNQHLLCKPGGLHTEVNCHDPHDVVTIMGLLSTPSRADNFLSTVYTIHPLFMLPSIIHHGDITNNNTTILCFHCEL